MCIRDRNKGHLSPYDIVLTSRGTLGNVALYDKHIKYENVRINSCLLYTSELKQGTATGSRSLKKQKEN